MSFYAEVGRETFVERIVEFILVIIVTWVVAHYVAESVRSYFGDEPLNIVKLVLWGFLILVYYKLVRVVIKR
jgi:hypothetical protein